MRLVHVKRPRTMAKASAKTAATDAASFTVKIPLYNPPNTATINTIAGVAVRASRQRSFQGRRALVGAAASLELKDGRIASARVGVAGSCRNGRFAGFRRRVSL